VSKLVSARLFLPARSLLAAALGPNGSSDGIKHSLGDSSEGERVLGPSRVISSPSRAAFASIASSNVEG